MTTTYTSCGIDRCATPAELQALLDDKLDSKLACLVANHLESCAPCQQKLDRLTDQVGVAGDELVRASRSASSAILRQKLAEVLAATEVDSRADSPTSTDDLPGPQPASGGYEILEEVGAGGMGVVYRARDLRLNRIVAIKFLTGLDDDATARRRLLREARAAAKVEHPHVVAVHHVHEDEERRPFLVMQFVDGETLQQQITQHGRRQGRVAAALIARVAGALAAAHRQGVVHRDVKAGNIIIERATGQPKITDFGLAHSPCSTGRTWQNVLPGTPEYMSPEQFRSHGETDARSDIYSLGVTLYHALTGRPPFQGPASSVVKRILYEEPVAPRRLEPKVHRDLETICLKAMQKRPADRYQSAREMQDDLNRLLAGEPIRARRASCLEQAARWLQRRPERGLVLLLLLLCGLVAAGAAWWNGAQDRLHQTQHTSWQLQLRDTTRRLSAAHQTTEQLQSEVELKEAEKLQTVVEMALQQQAVFNASARDLQNTLLHPIRRGLKQQIEKSKAPRTPAAAFQLASLHRGYAGLCCKTRDQQAAVDSLVAADRLFDGLDSPPPGCSHGELWKIRADCKRDLAILLTQLGRPDEALPLHRAAQSLYDEVGQRRLAAVHLQLERAKNQIGLAAAIYLIEDESQGAIRLKGMIAEVREITRFSESLWLQNPVAMVETYHQLALALAPVDEDRAADSLREALAVCSHDPPPVSPAGHRYHSAQKFHDLAEDLYARQHHRLAVASLEHAIELYQRCHRAAAHARNGHVNTYSQLIDEAEMQIAEIERQLNN